MRNRSALAVAVFLIFASGMVSPALAGRALGVVPGDRATYSYHAHTSYIDSSDKNVTVDNFWNLTISVQAVNLSASLPYVQYSLKSDIIYQGEVLNSTTGVNQTIVFDPFDGGTYLGNLGFPAFIFTDVPNKTMNFGFTYPTGTKPPWAGPNDSQVPSNVTVLVTRTPQLIHVSLQDVIVGTTVPFMLSSMDFNARTGVMESLTILTHFADNFKNFYYTLLSFANVQPIDFTFLWYVAGAGIVALVAFELWRRPSRRQRTIAKMRRKK